MNDRIFLDTNILIYLYSEDEIEKREVSQKLIDNYVPLISTQVINELSNVMIKKFNLTPTTVSQIVEELADSCIVNMITIKTIQNAIKLVETYKYSYYDSLIIASALENKCDKIYSEDMQHGQIIKGQLEILNPFIGICYP